MNFIETRLDREAREVAQQFREGGYGPTEGEADLHTSEAAAIRDLEDRCLSSAREDCIRAFRMALQRTAESCP